MSPCLFESHTLDHINRLCEFYHSFFINILLISISLFLLSINFIRTIYFRYTFGWLLFVKFNKHASNVLYIFGCWHQNYSMNIFIHVFHFSYMFGLLLGIFSYLIHKLNWQIFCIHYFIFHTRYISCFIHVWLVVFG